MTCSGKDLDTRHEQAHRRIEQKIDRLSMEVVGLRVGLEVHKVKTSRWSLLLGGLASLAVAIGAVVLKGCA